MEEPIERSPDSHVRTSTRAQPGPSPSALATDRSSSRQRKHGPIPENHAPLPKWWWDQTLEVRQAIAVVTLVIVIGAFATMIIRWGSSDDAGIAEQLSPVAQEARLFVAALPPTRVATWEELAECESGGDWGAATGNGYYGGLQFTQTTWLEFGGTGSPHEATREEQIMRAEAVQEAQGWGAWPRCSATLGLSG